MAAGLDGGDGDDGKWKHGSGKERRWSVLQAQLQSRHLTRQAGARVGKYLLGIYKYEARVQCFLAVIDLNHLLNGGSKERKSHDAVKRMQIETGPLATEH